MNLSKVQKAIESDENFNNMSAERRQEYEKIRVELVKLREEYKKNIEAQRTFEADVKFNKLAMQLEKSKKMMGQMASVLGADSTINSLVLSPAKKYATGIFLVALCVGRLIRIPTRPKRKSRNELMLISAFWSECRDSNSRPLEPHSSAIPNFATPGYLLASFDRPSILAQRFKKCKHYFYFFKNFFSRWNRT